MAMGQRARLGFEVLAGGFWRRSSTAILIEGPPRGWARLSRCALAMAGASAWDCGHAPISLSPLDRNCQASRMFMCIAPRHTTQNCSRHGMCLAMRVCSARALAFAWRVRGGALRDARHVLGAAPGCGPSGGAPRGAHPHLIGHSGDAHQDAFDSVCRGAPGATGRPRGRGAPHRPAGWLGKAWCRSGPRSRRRILGHTFVQEICAPPGRPRPGRTIQKLSEKYTQSTIFDRRAPPGPKLYKKYTNNIRKVYTEYKFRPAQSIHKVSDKYTQSTKSAPGGPKYTTSIQQVSET